MNHAPTPAKPRPAPAHGFVLVTALIFLVVLTLVAVTAVKSTGLELRMSSNNALHTEAFEAAEAPRQVVGRLLEKLGFDPATGWSAVTLPDEFAFLDSGRIGGTSAGDPKNWFDDIPESDFNYSAFTPVIGYTLNSTVSGASNYAAPSAEVSVQRMRTAQKAGCDLSGGGYDNISSKNCLDFFFYIQSRGKDGSGTTDYETSSVYRFVPSN